MAKALSAATKLKIARSLKGNKNAFKGGPKAKLTTRQKIANINAAAKANKAKLSSDQIARRQSVAKRLRAQARREEALGGGNPGTMKTNADQLSETLAKSDRLKQGGLEAMKSAKSADDIRAATAKIREARNALKEGAPQSTRKESQAKVQPRAKQNLNAPQSPIQDKGVKLEQVPLKRDDPVAELSRQRARSAAVEAAAQERRRLFAEQRLAARNTPEAKAARVTEQRRVFDMASTGRKSQGPVPGHDAKSVQGKPTAMQSLDVLKSQEAAAQAKLDRAEERRRANAYGKRPGAQSNAEIRARGELRAIQGKRLEAEKTQSTPSENVVVPGSRKAGRKTDPLKALFKEMAADDRRTASLSAKAENAKNAYERARERRRANPKTNRIESVAEGRARAKATEARRALDAHTMAVNAKRNQPQPPQSDTGSDRTQFSKDVPVTGEKKSRTKTGLIETEADYAKFVEDSAPALIKRLAKGVSPEMEAELRAEILKDLGPEGLAAYKDIMGK